MATYFKGGTFAEQQTQMAPINALLTSGQYRDVPATILPAYLRGQKSLEETVAAIKGTPVFNPSIGPQVDTGSGPQPLKLGTPGSGLNAPGQGFYTPEILGNAAKAIQQRLTQVSTQVASTVPTRNVAPVAPPPAAPSKAAPGAPAAPTSFQDTLDSLRSLLAGGAPGAAPAISGAAPTAPNLSGQLGNFQQQSGVAGAQQDVLTAKTELQNFEASLLGEQDKIKATRGVSSTFVQGKLVKLSADTAEAYRQKQNALSDASSRLQMANSTLSTMIDLAKFDSQTARDIYNDTFTRNYQMFSLLNTMQNQQQNNASANLKTILDVTKDKQIDLSQITPEMRASWNSMELAAGLSQGFTEGILKAAPTLKVDHWVTDSDSGKTYAYGMVNGKPSLLETFSTGAPTGQVLASGPEQAALTDAFNFLSARMTKDEAQRGTKYFNGLLQRGDYENAAQYLKSTAIANLPATEQQKALGRFQAVDALDAIKNDLTQFVANGGNTDIFSGTAEDIFQAVGATTNPELARIGNNIAMSIIAYRNAVSGAAFTESEAKQYEKVFPSIGKVPELNYAKIQSLQDTLNLNNKSIFSQVLGPSNYDKIMSGFSANVPAEQIDSEYQAYSQQSGQQDWLSGLLSSINIAGITLFK